MRIRRNIPAVRFLMALVAGVSLLALALSTAPAGAANPAPPAGRAMSNLAWGCPEGYSCYSCYYSEVNGAGHRWIAPACGFHGLRPTGLENRLFSIENRGNGVASVYNWTGHGYELKGWVHAGLTGNFPQNVSADLVHIAC